MKLLKQLIICFATVFLLSFPTTAHLGGEERWPFKVGQDQYAKYLFQGYDIGLHRLIAPPERRQSQNCIVGLGRLATGRNHPCERKTCVHAKTGVPGMDCNGHPY